MMKEDKYNKFLVLNREYKYLFREIAKMFKFNVKFVLKVHHNLSNGIEQNKVNKVHEILEDSESKEVLNAKINLIMTGNWSCIDQLDITKQQYFSNEILKLNDKEIFLDLGAFDGNTVLEFVRAVNYCYKKVIAFEPAENNYKKLIYTLSSENIKNVDIYNIGTWNEKIILNFSSVQGPGAYINSSGGYKVQVDTLDNLLLDTPITFIKMDIEGAEKETLLGAKQLIKKYKPKLAISVYHKVEDIYEIPLLLKKIVPEYKIYLRHHTAYLSETVCYAYV